MRKQYHSRKSGDDLLTWDVHHLVKLSKDLPIIEVPLSSIIELDENYWFQAKEDIPTIRQIAMHMKLVQEVEDNYPIILCEAGRVMDGMHRVCKAHLKGQATICAVQFSQTPPPDYVNVNPNTLSYD